MDRTAEGFRRIGFAVLALGLLIVWAILQPGYLDALVSGIM